MSQPYANLPIQSGTANNTSSTTTDLTYTFGSSVTAGSLIVVYAAWNSSGSGNQPTISDGTNTYTAAVVDTTYTNKVGIWYYVNAAGGSLTITMHHASIAMYKSMQCVEFPGTSSVAVDTTSGGGASTSGTMQISPSFTPTATGNLMCCAAACDQAIRYLPATMYCGYLPGLTGSGSVVCLGATFGLALSTSSQTISLYGSSSIGSVPRSVVTVFKNMPAPSGGGGSTFLSQLGLRTGTRL